MTALFLIGCSTIIVMMVLVIVIGIARAPEGYEDSTGFHHGKCPDPVCTQAERKRPRQLGTTIPDESNAALDSRKYDAIVSLKKQIRVPAKLLKQSPADKSRSASLKAKALREEEIPPSFGASSGGTAVSDSNSPFPLPDPTGDDESFDTKP